MSAEGGGERGEDWQGHTVAPRTPEEPSKPPIGGQHNYTDGRKPWDWDSRYPPEARRLMNTEAWTLIGFLLLSLIGTSACLGLADEQYWIEIGSVHLYISFRLLAIFSAGCVGGVTFSIKWLIHAAAKGKWHRDRRYWRLMVPAIGGVYACVVMTLFSSGMLNAQATQLGAIPGTAALAFLVGYFSDGVSGLLSNIANAMFGTLEKK